MKDKSKTVSVLCMCHSLSGVNNIGIAYRVRTGAGIIYSSNDGGGAGVFGVPIDSQRDPTTCLQQRWFGVTGPIAPYYRVTYRAILQASGAQTIINDGTSWSGNAAECMIGFEVWITSIFDDDDWSRWNDVITIESSSGQSQSIAFGGSGADSLMIHSAFASICGDSCSCILPTSFCSLFGSHLSLVFCFLLFVP
jgi:hypothetical protein